MRMGPSQRAAGVSKLRLLAGTMAACAASLSLAPTAGAVPSLPGAPPVTQSSFQLEAVGSLPVDNDQRIPAPSTPPPPVCTAPILTAPSDGAITALQARIDNDVAAGVAFKGDTICLNGTFRAPIHVREKFSTELLTIASAPGAAATFDLAGRAPSYSTDNDPNEFDNGDLGAIEVGDSRDVEIYGLTIENWKTSDINLAPAGIYVTTTRTDANAGDSGVTESACYTKSPDGVCGDIFIYDNTVKAVETTAPGCGDLGDGNYGNAFGIAVKAFGDNSAQSLQHVVIEGNTVTQTLTGQSETVTVNGDVTDFLVAGNTITDVNNIGIDAIGWETGGAALAGGHSASQARNGLIIDNHVSNVDTRLNPGYGIASGSSCNPGDMDAGGIYVDGASHLWIDDNTVIDTNHGIELNAEDQDGQPGEFADQLLVTGNTVADGVGDGFGEPTKPYDDAGHAYAAFIVGGEADNAGDSSSVRNVYAHGNTFTNQSQFFVDPTQPPPPDPAAVVLFEGGWGDVWLLGNTITGNGSSDELNPLLEVDTSPGFSPTAAPGVVVDCNSYGGSSTVSNNFLSPTDGWTPFSGSGSYQRDNGLPTSELGVAPPRWDADSASSGPSSCPFTLPDSGPGPAPPAVAIVAPAGGVTYAVGEVVDAGFSCAEGVGGPGLVASGGCVGTVANGAPVDTATAGSKIFSVTAVSKDGLSSTASVDYEVTGSPPASGAPANVGLSVIGGVAKAGRVLSCFEGLWSHVPTGFGYQWGRDGTPIAGATDPMYTVGVGDEGLVLTCTVTASNGIGVGSAVSEGVAVRVPVVRRCPGATGRLTGVTLGLVRLGMTRARARRVYRRSSDRAGRDEDLFCLTPFGVRVGYASAALLKALHREDRKRFVGRVIWALTASAFYAVRGVRPGAGVTAAAAALELGAPFQIGPNDWYLAPSGASTAILEVRDGIVEQVGIADHQFTKGRHAQLTLLKSFA
jgi:hypothetical protein